MSSYSRHMAYISHEPLRREPWRGYEDAAGVARSIKWFASNGGAGNLTVYSRGRISADGRSFYMEIPREQWAEIFGAAA